MEGCAHPPSARGSLWNAWACDAGGRHTCHPTRRTPGPPGVGIGTAPPEHTPADMPAGEARAETARRLQSPLRVPRGRSGRGKSLWAPARNCKRAGAASLKTSEHRGGGSQAREPPGLGQSEAGGGRGRRVRPGCEWGAAVAAAEARAGARAGALSPQRRAGAAAAEAEAAAEAFCSAPLRERCGARRCAAASSQGDVPGISPAR